MTRKRDGIFWISGFTVPQGFTAWKALENLVLPWNAPVISLFPDSP
jgi:hypothetical protein